MSKSYKHTERHATWMTFEHGEVLRVFHNRTGRLIELMKVIGYTKPGREIGEVVFEVTKL